MTVCAGFEVIGVPAPQGSKTRTKWGGMREANAATRPWREAVAWTAREWMQGRELYTGPVTVSALFFFPRPKAHFGTGRNASNLKASAPVWVTTKPDGDKLMRAIGDAMTGIVYRDDSQIVDGAWAKLYGVPRAVIVVSACATTNKNQSSPEVGSRESNAKGIAA